MYKILIVKVFITYAASTQGQINHKAVKALYPGPLKKGGPRICL